MTSWILQWGEEGEGGVRIHEAKAGGEKKNSDSTSDRAWPLCAICCFMTQEMHKGFADSSVRSLAAPPPSYGFIFLLIHW